MLTTIEAPIEIRATAWRRRRDVLDVLDPARSIQYAHLDRAVGLAIIHGWNVKPCRPGYVRASYSERTIWTTPIAGDTELAAFAHEGGHVEDVTDRPGVVIERDGIRWVCDFESELNAWRFALRVLGYRWNDTMNRFMSDCLWSYRPGYVGTWENRRAMDALIAEGAELAKHYVRIDD